MCFVQSNPERGEGVGKFVHIVLEELLLFRVFYTRQASTLHQQQRSCHSVQFTATLLRLNWIVSYRAVYNRWQHWTIQFAPLQTNNNNP